MNLLWFTPPQLGHLVFLTPFLIQEFLSLELIGLPRFNRVMNKYQLYLEHLAVGICDLFTLFVSVKKHLIIDWLICEWIIIWILSSHSFVWGSREIMIIHSKCFLSSPNVGKTYSSKIIVDKSNCKYVSYPTYILNCL